MVMVLVKNSFSSPKLPRKIFSIFLPRIQRSRETSIHSSYPLLFLNWFLDSKNSTLLLKFHLQGKKAERNWKDTVYHSYLPQEFGFIWDLC